MESIENIAKFEAHFSESYGKGTIIEAIVTQIIKPSQIITEFYEGFVGRLSLLNVSWCLPEAEQRLKRIEIGTKIKCVVLDIDFKSKQVQLSQKHLEKPISDGIKWERIERGDEYTVKIIESLNDSCIVRTEHGIYGLLHKSFTRNVSGPLRVKVNSKFDYNDLISFVPASLEIDLELEEDESIERFRFIDEELQSFNKFKRSLIGVNASDSQCEVIQTGFETDERIFSKEFSTKHTLFIQFEMNSPSYEITFKQQAIPYFTNGTMYTEEAERALLEKLSKEKYWFKINRRLNKHREGSKDTSEIIEFSLFNEHINFFGEVLISKDKKEQKFAIRNFSFGHSFAGASDAKKRNAKFGSFLFSNSLKILSPFGTLPLGTSQSEILEYALLKTSCFDLINALKLDAGEILKQEGRTLAINDKFLEYQIRLIQEKKESGVFVKVYSQIPSKTGGICIQLSSDLANALDIAEDTPVKTSVKVGDDLKKFAEGIISFKDGVCKLTFYKSVRLAILSDGFYIDKSISTSQFQVQREIIQDFLEKKIRIDHIEALLVHPEKVKTPELAAIDFKNQDLERTEQEDPQNLQPLAVRKAVGSKDIFLIQGPPGTGKTTVIAEVIEQLVERGEKILVSGQNHVSVDNVLSKISKISKLNLLRIGNPDRVDKDLVRYCIDNLVADYRTDFHRFISNQHILTKEYLRLIQSEVDEETFTKAFNEKVNALSIEYGQLKEVYKQRHFILRDGLRELSEQEISDAINALEAWIDSNNNDYEILLKPLIYNAVDVVFATCIGIKSDDIFKDSNFKFDTVIIDEAGKANISETLVAIGLGKKVILVGDQMQLPPYMDSSLIDEGDPSSFPKSMYGLSYTQDEIVHALKTSFFEFIINRIEGGHFPQGNKIMLNYQHRMHPNIGRFVSESFYDGLVQMGSRTHLNRLELPPPFNKEVIFFDTSNSRNPYEQNDGYSAKNNTEAEIVSEIILPKLFEHDISASNVAVIAPYKSQVSNILEYIKNSELCKIKNIDVSTLDSFQGKEYDIIIFSFTRSANFNRPEFHEGKRKSTKVGFLDDARRLNVAFSRAKKKLILVGNATTLVDARSHYDGLFNYTRLFRKLVQLSRSDEIGSFVNIADLADFKSHFASFLEKYKEGDFVFGIVKEKPISKKTGKMVGAIINIEGVTVLAPYYHIASASLLNKNFFRYNDGQKVIVRITEIVPNDKKILVQIMEGNWYKNILSIEGKEMLGELFQALPHGRLVKLCNGIVGLLNTKSNPQIRFKKDGDMVPVVLSTVNLSTKKVNFKLL